MGKNLGMEFTSNIKRRINSLFSLDAQLLTLATSSSLSINFIGVGKKRIEKMDFGVMVKRTLIPSTNTVERLDGLYNLAKVLTKSSSWNV
jgi:hypothetical protein